MKILVTGGGGQVGREFADLQDPNVIVLSRAECDITSVQSITAVINEHQPTIIVNTAAYTAVDKAEKEVELAYQINRDGVANLAKACAQADIPLIHLSTDYVFDGTKKGAYCETDVPNPQSIYGKSKLAGEEVLMALHGKHIIVRVSWVFGQYGKNFVKTIQRLASERDELKIVADQIGCPTSAASIANMIIQLCDKINKGQEKWGLFHYCNAPATTWFEFAKKIIAASNVNKPLSVLPLATKEYPTPAKRPANSVLNCDKIQAVFDIMQADWQQELVMVCQQLVGFQGKATV